MIPLKNIHSKELIQQLFDQNIAIGSRVNDLENEVKSLRSDFKNMSHIIENLKQSVKKFEENK
jgi:predicted RNase H-like nuclease (RuvC/YqgF family)